MNSQENEKFELSVNKPATLKIWEMKLCLLLITNMYMSGNLHLVGWLQSYSSKTTLLS